jgi:predicted nucleotidyltransferase
MNPSKGTAKIVPPAREGDFLQTVDGLIFDVKGDCHPPDRIISFVRYIPDSEGDRKRGKEVYRKVYDLKERYQVLKKEYPQYVYFDPVFQRELQGVPHEYIQKMYNPREKLKELIPKEKDALEESAVLLAQMLPVPDSVVGVSGSILVGLHTPGSDIDLIVYGTQHCINVYNHLKTLREKGVIQQFDREEARKKALFRWGHAPELLVRLEQKKVLHGLFQGKEYFFRLLKENTLQYGDVHYRPLDTVTMKAVITDDTDNIFTPCCYKVEDASVEEVEQIVSVRGRFCEHVQKGDTVTARGSLETVLCQTGEYYQLMLGDQGDYLLPESHVDTG